MAAPPPAAGRGAWLAYALGVVLGCVAGLLAAELSFMATGAITGRDWGDAHAWQYVVAGVAFLAAAMGVMIWVGRRVREIVRRS